MKNFLIIFGFLFCISITPKTDYIGHEFDENPEPTVIKTQSDYRDTGDRITYNVSRGNYEHKTNKKINISERDRELLAKLLWTEARGENDDCQKAVVSVIINRVNSGYWGNSIHSVITAKGQFDLGNKLDNIKPNQKQYEIVDYVLENGITIPENVIYFRAGHFHSWATDYKKIDKTYFSSK